MIGFKMKKKVAAQAHRDTCCALGFCALCGNMVDTPPLVSAMGRKMDAFLAPLRIRKRAKGAAEIGGLGCRRS